MSVEVLRSGALTTVQDAGRFGFRREGVSVCGALDGFAYRVANLLVGNADDAAVLEITLAGCALRFQRDTLIAVCGADLSPSVSGQLINDWRPVFIEANAELIFRKRVTGCRAYLAVAGGFNVPPVLGSRSTDLRARIGGLDGHALRSGDVLRSGASNDLTAKALASLRPADDASHSAYSRWFVSHHVRPQYSPRPMLRVIRGSEFGRLTEASRRALFECELSVASESDRMGYRLRGFTFECESDAGRLSAAVAPGTIQVPPGGDPVLLLADCQTTGGYPVVAHVIAADLPLVAQTAPGDRLRFVEVTLEEAQRLNFERERTLRLIEYAVGCKFSSSKN